jgi:hypothetical protein
MTELTPSERIKAMTQVASDKIKKAVDNLLRKKDSEKVREENRKAEIKTCAEESMTLMNDARYPRHQKFLTELRSAYSRKLEQTDPSRIADIAKIQGKIENLDVLINRPKYAVKEYEAIIKELK